VLSDLELIDLHEHLVEYLLLEREQQNAVQRRVADDPCAVQRVDTERSRRAGQGRNSLVRNMADLRVGMVDTRELQ
jgi:hypothetical protein